MKTRTSYRGWALFSLLVATTVACPAAPFSAELTDTRGAQTTRGTFNSGEAGYRFDLGDGEQRLIVIVDRASGVVRLVSPAEKRYLEKSPDDPSTPLLNPFSAYAQLAKTKSVRTEGTEPVGGIACRKQVVFSGEQVFVIAWVADEFDVPLKVSIPIYAITDELTKIQRGPQDAALFTVPAGYALQVETVEPPPQPKWLDQVARAPLLTVPFERTLNAGAILRLRPQAGRSIAIEGANVGRVQGTFTLVPFKGGKSKGPGEMATVVVDPGESGSITTGASPETTDEVVVRADQAPFRIKASFAAPTGPGSPTAAGDSPANSDAAAVAAGVGGPASANVAARLEVPWQGPASNDDFIAVALPAKPAGSFLDRAFVRAGNPAKLWAPSDAGDYELRYVQGHGMKILARAPLTVAAVTASVEAPASAAAGAEFEVRWQGPGNSDDYVSVARPNQPPGATLSLVRVRAGGTLKLRAPKQAGTYEVRYILGRGHRLLTKSTIVVGPAAP